MNEPQSAKPQQSLDTLSHREKNRIIMALVAILSISLGVGGSGIIRLDKYGFSDSIRDKQNLRLEIQAVDHRSENRHNEQQGDIRELRTMIQALAQDLADHTKGYEERRNDMRALTRDVKEIKRALRMQ